jgi:rhodanese-related sulfurtransferase
MIDISTEQLMEKLEKGEKPIMIDVREPFEYEEYNIGAELIPMGRLQVELENFEDKKEDEIIMICRSGARSGNATAYMRQIGFKNVKNLIGGMLRWQDLSNKN